MKPIIEKIALHIPDTFLSAKEISELSKLPENYFLSKLGLKQKPVCPPNTQSSDLAELTANRILDGQDKDLINLVIWTGTGKQDRATWSASTNLIQRLNLKNAWGIDLFAQSACDVIALRIAKNIIESDPTINKVLIAGGHLLSQLIDYSDKTTSFLFNFADGAAAVLISKGTNNLVLGSSTLSDSSFSNDVVLERRVIESINQGDFAEKFALKSDEGFKQRLIQASTKNYQTVITDALKQSNTPSLISHLFINHLSPSLHKTLLSNLQLSITQSRYLFDFGHVGSIDPWISLGIAEKEKSITPNSLICVASAGLGYTWSATCFLWTHDLVHFV